MTAALPLHVSPEAAMSVMPHRRRQIADKVLISNDFGEWAMLTPDDYARYLGGAIVEGDPVHALLTERGFVADHLDEAVLAQKLRRRYGFLASGPHLHVIVVTLRCDHTCRYCHASRVSMATPGTDMTRETAEHVVDRAFESPSEFLLFEFQGGEPLANFDAVQHVVRVAKERNKIERRKIGFVMVSNLSLMTEERLDWLIAEGVEICTSLDGPADLHDFNRKTRDGGAHGRVVQWIERINQRYVDEGMDSSLYRVEALLTMTRPSLARWKEVIDAYVAVGCRAVFLRALNPFGFARAAGGIGYPIDEWLAMYRDAVDYILELNRQGVQILERNLGILLTKILSGVDPNYLDMRSPCGATIGQVAYNYDGTVFTCDEGRMVSQQGDDAFALGNVRDHTWSDMVAHPTARALILSSTLDANVSCTRCVHKPYCGTCPVQNYAHQGSLNGRVLDSTLCKKHMGLLDYAFEVVDRSTRDPELAEILRRWTISRPKEALVHT